MPADSPPTGPFTSPHERRAAHDYDLHIRAEAPGQTWLATLVERTSGARTEFDTPLALLRFITRDTVVVRSGGLR